MKGAGHPAVGISSLFGCAAGAKRWVASGTGTNALRFALVHNPGSPSEGSQIMSRTDPLSNEIGESEVLVNRLLRILLQKKMRLVTAESCTAGSLSFKVSAAEGAGEALEGGFVVYTKSAKSRMLGVSSSLLQRCGAVDEDVACAMATGALKRAPGADISIALTGVTGPKRDDDGNPVGLVYICVCCRGGEPVSRKYMFEGVPPPEVCTSAINAALRLAAGVLVRDKRVAPKMKQATALHAGNGRAG